jgi:TP901 family phage tail tape measure protein
MALRTVGVRLVAEISDYQRKLKTAGESTRSFAGEMAQAAKGGHLDAVADQAGIAGLALAGVAGTAVKLSMDFEKSMSAVSAATHASAKDMEQLRQAALEAGKDTQYSATQAADAITELSKAGVATADVLGGGLDGALDLAAAGQIDVAEAAETAASAMTQFKLKGRDIPHVADLLAAAAGKAQGTVHDMSAALNQAGLVAAQTGLSIEETTGTLAAFASAGLTGSDAGTSFKQMLLMLQAPSEKTQGLMEDLGISAYDAQGQFIGITALAGQLKDKLSQLTPEVRANAMAQIFGADATRAASILYEQGADGIQAWIGKVNDAGYASETAAKLTDNLAGDLERLKGSLETLAIESGGGANSGLRVVAKSTEALVDQFGQLPPAIGGTVTVLAGLSGTLLLGAAGWVKMRRSNAEALDELRATGPAGDRAATGLQKTQKWAGRAAAAFVAAQVAAAGVSAAFGNDLNPQTDALAQNLEKWAISGEMAGEATRLLGKDFEHLGYDLSTLDSGFWAGLGNGISGTVESLTGLGDVADESLTHAKERISALDAALSQMVQNGRTETAAAIFKKLADEAEKSGVNVDELKKGMPQYAAAVQTAGSATKETATSVTGLGESAEDAADQVETLNKALKDAFAAQMSADRAALKLEESTVGLTKELSKGAKTLSLNSEEGRKNRTAVLDQLAAIEDLREARVDEGATLDEANRKYVKDIDGLRKTMAQAGFTKKQIDDLTGAYRKLPEKVATQIGTPGLIAAREGIKGYDTQLDKLARNVTTQVSVDGKAKAYKELTDLLILQQAAKKGISVSAAASAFRKNAGYATGGWTGPGGTYDEAGVVHADEYVIKKSSRRKIEATAPGLLDEMNATGRVPGYATGGLVMPFPVNVKDMKIPSWDAPPAGGGRTSDWIVSAVHAAFPGLRVLSKDRPGAVTLTGNTSYHARGRAVDFEPSRALAEWVNANYFAATRELITPWQSLNIQNGRRHSYSPIVYNQHNFAGGNAHDHWAMAHGGTITEPIFGVGASGRTYSFGENYQPERVMPNWQPAGSGGGAGVSTTINLNVALAAGANPREAGRQIAEQLQTYLVGGGSVYVRGTKVL